MRSIALFPLRSAAFAIGLYAYWMETAADFVIGASSTTEYVREGSCLRCGKCCRLLAVEMPKFMAKRPWMAKLAMVWHDLAFNFEPKGVTDRFLVYRCRYFKEDKGGPRCSIYPFRHRLCRFFPKQRIYGKYELGDDCGFKFVKRDVVKRLRDRRREGKRVFEDLMKAGRENRSPL